MYFFTRERVSEEKLCLLDIFKIGIFIKYSFKVLAISASWDKILSFSARVILESILTLFEVFRFKIFKKPLLSVTVQETSQFK